MHDLSVKHAALADEAQQQLIHINELRKQLSDLESKHRTTVKRVQSLEPRIAQAIHRGLLQHSCVKASDPDCIKMRVVADRFYLACHTAYRRTFRGAKIDFHLDHLVGMRRLLKNLRYTQELMTHFMELNDDYKRIYLNKVPK